MKERRSADGLAQSALKVVAKNAGWLAVAAVTAVFSVGTAGAQVTTTTQTTTSQTTPGTPAPGVPQETVTSTTTFHRGKKKPDKTVASKDTKKNEKADEKSKAEAAAAARLPDKQLYDKALTSINNGRYDVARLDLQTMLNTYPDSQYQMRAKLAIADSWYKEGGTAALTQAESEYSDFRIFFPNAPEAAEAQMRIGDIYFRQMDRPDRDYSKAVHAEEEYRRMLTDYPNAPPALLKQAKQRLRDVQEVLAQREADIAAYYATRDNYAAVIARNQTVVDTYPLYSHLDDVLIGLGDAYEAEAKFIRGLKTLPEGPKSKLEQIYDGQAAKCYREVVLEHAAAPHVEDAKDRLQAMNLPIPVPTADQLAASEALENSRATYKITDRAKLMFLHTPDVVTSARLGDPSLTDPAPTIAPAVSKQVQTDFRNALASAAPPAAVNRAVVATTGSAPAAGTATDPALPATESAAPTPATPMPLKFEDVPAGTDGTTGGNVETTPALAAPPTVSSGGVSTGTSVEILSTGAPVRASEDHSEGGLAPVGPANTAPLPAATAPAEAPDRINEAAGQKTPAAQAAPANGKKPKVEYDKKAESDSKHKKKKGLDKLNPL